MPTITPNRLAVRDFVGRAPNATYAISVFHGENSNGKLDTNFLGMPRGGMGASNGAKGHFGPPKFVAAAFRFQGGHIGSENYDRLLVGLLGCLRHHDGNNLVARKARSTFSPRAG
jgi:hypothetical protein